MQGFRWHPRHNARSHHHSCRFFASVAAGPGGLGHCRHGDHSADSSRSSKCAQHIQAKPRTAEDIPLLTATDQAPKQAKHTLGRIAGDPAQSGSRWTAAADAHGETVGQVSLAAAEAVVYRLTHRPNAGLACRRWGLGPDCIPAADDTVARRRKPWPRRGRTGHTRLFLPMWMMTSGKCKACSREGSKTIAQSPRVPSCTRRPSRHRFPMSDFVQAFCRRVIMLRAAGSVQATD